MLAPARVAAYRTLQLVETMDLSHALAEARDVLPQARDRALATELVLGTLRWRGALDHQIQRVSGRTLHRLDDPVLRVLRLSAYQLLYLTKVPSSAIVNDAVEIIKTRARLKSAAPFVNAVLRRLTRERESLTWPQPPRVLETPKDRSDLVEYLSVVHSHPAWLVDRWLDRYGVNATEHWLRFNNETPTLTLATNRLMGSREELAGRLEREGIRSAPTGVAPHGARVLDGHPLSSEAFRDGACLVQDEASQLIPELVAAREGARVLDLCAAPGKTVALAAQVGPAGLIIASDVRSHRMAILAATLERCRVHRSALVHIAPTGALPFRAEAFDAVLVDAPCSGLGTVRRDPDIKWKRAPDDLAGYARAQGDLLRSVAPAVATGGRLVYSTCSSEPEEDENVVGAFLDGHREFTLLPIGSLHVLPSAIRALATPEGCMRTLPPRDGLEAFFGAVLQRAF